MRRALALWLLLFGVYAATLGLHDQHGDARHYLLAAESLQHDGDVDLLNQYAQRGVRPRGELTAGRLNEPYGIGFPLLILPAYALGGDKAVELFLAAIAALALVFAYRLALRAAPDPWALGAAAAIGLSPPLLAYGTAVYPELTAGAVLAGAALLALRPHAALGVLVEHVHVAVVPERLGCEQVVGGVASLVVKSERRRVDAEQQQPQGEGTAHGGAD